jgi:subtilisin family serine protease
MVRIASLAAFAATASATVSPRLLRQLETSDSATILVTFKQGSGLEKLNTESLSREERAQSVFNTLTAENYAITASAVELAKAAGVEFTQFWISPNVLVKGANKALVEKLGALSNVVSVAAEQIFTLPAIVETNVIAANSTSDSTNESNEWGVEIIGAPTAWARGNKGKGVVVANIDTGVRGTHEALKGNFRAANGWYEPSTKSKAPNDRHGHGTHVIGSIAGGLGIGVAPESQWIACVGCPAGSCPQSDLLACAQFITCPTDTDGKNPDCKLAPHVINNSWGSTQNGQTWYEASILAWRKAGIVPVFANGNAGPNCGTVGSPGDSPSVIGVGATDSADALASFSSKGPEPLQKRIKPDVSAPGRSIRSAGFSADNAYATFSGTSMAAPHTAGAVALILNANPGATYETVYKLITGTVDTASLKPSTANCGGVDNSKYPNNDFGFGRINANKASAAGPTPTTTKPAC